MLAMIVLYERIDNSVETRTHRWRNFKVVVEVYVGGVISKYVFSSFVSAKCVKNGKLNISNLHIENYRILKID